MSECVSLLIVCTLTEGGNNASVGLGNWWKTAKDDSICAWCRTVSSLARCTLIFTSFKITASVGSCGRGIYF